MPSHALCHPFPCPAFKIPLMAALQDSALVLAAQVEPCSRNATFCHCSPEIKIVCRTHDDVIKWKHFPRYWPFVRGIHRSPVNSSHKGQWRGALMFSLICAWIDDKANSREAGGSRRYPTHCDVIVMLSKSINASQGWGSLGPPFTNMDYHWFRDG